MTERRKLIEVALPLEAINDASAKEKSIRHGHPSSLHLWWSRKPLATCRAILFASLVDDPSSRPDLYPTEDEQRSERTRLFGIIEQLVRWENTASSDTLGLARRAIEASTEGEPPAILDPFCGGGSIPLEAQRLGLRTYAADLNPVAVLITKALVEIPFAFANRPPVHPAARELLGSSGSWVRAAGLADDIRRYAASVRTEAERVLGHLYPSVQLPTEKGGGRATVIAWLWGRTVQCPNPACGAEAILTSKFTVSTVKGRRIWIRPNVNRAAHTFALEVTSDPGPIPEPTVDRHGGRCIVCETPIPFEHIRSEGRADRMGRRLMAIVANGPSGRTYVSPDPEHVRVASSALPAWEPDVELPRNPRDFKTPNYGINSFSGLFTKRQLVVLAKLSDLVSQARESILRDAISAGLDDDDVPLHQGGSGARAYAEAVTTYLALAVSRLADNNSSLTLWSQSRDQIVHTFGRQALPMVWDYAEANPFAKAAGDLSVAAESVAQAIASVPATISARVRQLDATQTADGDGVQVVATDPPYYDNIGYGDLSDFFYVWLRRSLGTTFPDLFSTLLSPKAGELVATPYRFGGDRSAAKDAFESGLAEAFVRIREASSPEYPVIVFYAFKQTETEERADGAGTATVSTGWETMLEGLLRAGFTINGTWPMRTERAGRILALGKNALASSIVLVCRPRPAKAPLTSRGAFISQLRDDLPRALRDLQHGSIAPVDLAQASIGPGMSVFSRFTRVLEPDGSAMTVRTALGLINQVLDEILAQQDGEFDADTRWAVTWFEQHGAGEGRYGEAETLSTAKDTSVEGLTRAGIVRAGSGRVRVLMRGDLPAEWDPHVDRRPTVWEATQHLVKQLETGGELAAARVVAKIGGFADLAKDLAYRLYAISNRRGSAEEAAAYNRLVASWPEIQRLALEERTRATQASLEL